MGLGKRAAHPNLIVLEVFPPPPPSEYCPREILKNDVQICFILIIN